jgi:hypothetical protein
VTPAHPFEPPNRGAPKGSDFGLAQKLDIWPHFDALDQLARHRRSKTVRAHQAPNLAEPPETLDLVRPESWEHLIAALFYRGHDRITLRVTHASYFELYHVEGD